MSEYRFFIDSKNIDRINEYCEGGFYVADAMFVMEKELPEFIQANDLDNPFVSIYDTSDMAEYLKANGKGFGTPDPIEKLEHDLNHPGSAIYVYRVDGHIASSVTIWDEDDDTVSTENIFTVPKYRGKGYATAVLSSALYDAYKRGKLKAKLTVYAGDIAAVKMYYKFGFKITRILQELKHE